MRPIPAHFLAGEWHKHGRRWPEALYRATGAPCAVKISGTHSLFHGRKVMAHPDGPNARRRHEDALLSQLVAGSDLAMSGQDRGKLAQRLLCRFLHPIFHIWFSAAGFKHGLYATALRLLGTDKTYPWKSP